MIRWLLTGLTLLAAAASCKTREPAHEQATSAAAPPPSSVAPARSAVAPPPPEAPSAVASAAPAAAPAGAPRTKEYSWMSTAAWHEKHEALVARAKQGHIELLFLGDSITEGWLDNAAWQSHYARRSPANFGIGGDTVENVLWRIEHGELEGLAPKVLVLLIGTNNLGLQGDAPDAVARKIEGLVDALREKLPATKVLLLAVFPRGALPDGEMRAKVAKVNARIAKLDDGSRVRFLNLGPKLLLANGTLSNEVAPDGLHLSEQGYAIWAEGMEPLLKEMLRPQ